MKLFKVNELVKEILSSEPITRDSDKMLYLKVVERLNPSLLTKPFAYAIKDTSLPSYESVTRTRRKIQETNPDLCASEQVEGFRIVLEEQYEDYAKKVFV